ncbi:hypothetical protein JAAARDRAFT_133008 [Jaapia argillacea MUCL 33604]|uniref:U6 small nuclear RNA (adenine-(43)-N(6))-methyltransferase n=1 Tax=Jaapia argillacea MUCL 33604 TaxID=933084 RepID=A0A067PY43_9AGAM|nr:hypothetical protein JAAARDRAFT_133008 [Jaapia argillacea MUCL 33604]
MHQRNPYRQPLDFALLSKNYPSLRSHLIGTHAGTVTIDFKNEASLRCLTEALLQLDFGLRLSLAEDRLCPPVPNRLNYILWLQDIIDASCLDQTEPVRGIDIGTGASTIYPLIGCALNPNWFFTGTDIDTTSLAFAHRNITQNSLQHRITLLQASSSSDDPILVPFALDPNAFDFTMCNPPFYSSVEDVAKSADMKVLQPHAVRLASLHPVHPFPSQLSSSSIPNDTSSDIYPFQRYAQVLRSR